MGMYLDALLLLGAVALIAGIVLTLAAKFMAVPVNETQVKIRAVSYTHLDVYKRQLYNLN